MASGYWTESASRALNSTSNWSGGANPGANEKMLYMAGAGNLGPNSSMTTLSTVNLALLQYGPGCLYDVGGAGNHIEIGADVVKVEGTKTLYLSQSTSTSVTQTDVVHVDVAPQTAISSVSAVSMTGGTFGLLTITRGRVTVEASSTITDIVCAPLVSGVNDAYLDIGSGCTLASMDVRGGIVTSDSAITTVRAYGGVHTQKTAAITNLHVYPGARVNLHFSGTYAAVYHYGGVIDATVSPGFKTFTDYYRFFKREDAANTVRGLGDQITLTNAIH